MQLTSQCFSSHLFAWALEVTESFTFSRRTKQGPKGTQMWKASCGACKARQFGCPSLEQTADQSPKASSMVLCCMWHVGVYFQWADSSAYQLLQTWSMFLLLQLHGSLCSCNVIQKIRNQAPADLYVTGCLCGVYSPSCILLSSTAKSTGTCGKKWNLCNGKNPWNIGLDPSASVCLPFSGTT